MSEGGGGLRNEQAAESTDAGLSKVESEEDSVDLQGICDDGSFPD